MLPRRAERRADAPRLLPVTGDWYGTTLRVYDPGLDAWHILWSNPATQLYTRQIGRARGADIVQEGKHESGALLRWSFTRIRREFVPLAGRGLGRQRRQLAPPGRGPGPAVGVSPRNSPVSSPIRDKQAPPGFPSPLWGGARGGGNPDLRCSAIPPTLSLPHKGGGDAAARVVSSSRVGAAGDRLTPLRQRTLEPFAAQALEPWCQTPEGLTPPQGRPP